MLQTARPKEQQRCTLLFRNTLRADGSDQPWEFDRDLKLSEYGQQWRYPHAPMVGQHRDLARHTDASATSTPVAAATATVTTGNTIAETSTCASPRMDTTPCADGAASENDLLSASQFRQPARAASRALQPSPTRTDTPDTDSETLGPHAQTSGSTILTSTDAPLMHDLLAAAPATTSAAAPAVTTSTSGSGAIGSSFGGSMSASNADSSASRSAVTATKALPFAPTEAVL